MPVLQPVKACALSVLSVPLAMTSDHAEIVAGVTARNSRILGLGRHEEDNFARSIRAGAHDDAANVNAIRESRPKFALDSTRARSHFSFNARRRLSRARRPMFYGHIAAPRRRRRQRALAR